MFKVITKFPLAINSVDYLYPCGAKADNNTSINFILEIEDYFIKKVSALDLGCSGGQYIIDLVKRGYKNSLGLEGSDYHLIHNQENWLNYYNRNLFTCDISKEFLIKDEENNSAQFNVITAWEVLEHLTTEELEQLFINVKNHIKEDGIFLTSIGFKPNPILNTSLDHHVTQWEKSKWSEFLKRYWDVNSYVFSSGVRGFGEAKEDSYLFMLLPYRKYY